MVETAGARRAWFRRIPAAAWGLVALGVGMTLGTLYPAQLGFIGLGMKAAFRGLAAAAPFIIYFTISAAIFNMLGSGRAGRMAFWVTATFTGLGLLAGLVSILLLIPLFTLSTSAGGGSGAALLATLGDKTLLLMHSSQAFLAVIYAAITSVLVHHGARWKATAWICGPTRDVVRFVGVDGINAVGRGLKVAFPYLLLGIGIFIPGAIGDAVARTSQGVQSSAAITTPVGTSPVALYFLNVATQVLLLAVYISIVIVLVLWYTRFPVRQFFRDYFGPVYLFAWATSSSAATIPVALERTGDGLKVRKEVRDFVVPLGATMNLDGAMVACFVITSMASILVGYYPTALDMLLLLIPFKIVTMGVPGIPGGIATVVPPVAAGILPLPPGTEATFLAIWFAFAVGLSDQFRTGINTATNGIVALLFEKLYPKHFMKADTAVVDGADASEAAGAEAEAAVLVESGRR